MQEKLFGEIIDEDTGEEIEIDEDTEPVDFSWNPVYEPDFKFYDQNLLDRVKEGDEDVHEFFRLLAICHTGRYFSRITK